jgi:hypothetical protein
MTFRLVDKGWGQVMRETATADAGALRIICPFIKKGALQHLLDGRAPDAIQVITRFNLSDFSDGVSDIAALELLLARGAQVRGVRHLHAKLYLFGNSRAILTSANLTQAALFGNHEFGFVAAEPDITDQCRAYFDAMWRRAGPDLTSERVGGWEGKVTRYHAEGGRPGGKTRLGDEGVDIGLPQIPLVPGRGAADVPQAFVKFLGESSNRESLSWSTLGEIERAGCHWAVAYPASKRPSGVQDGALIFIARLTSDPNDIRIFGRAVGLAHQPGRDDATPEDIARRPWKEQWPRYVRVHDAEFVAGTMANGVSLNELMETLRSDSFASTQRNAGRGEGNTDPRRAYLQQAAVELSPEGIAWLTERLDAAFAAHGKVPVDTLATLDWPLVPG